MDSAIITIGNFIFTKNYDIAINPTKVTTDSEYLYIKDGFVINTDSPLFKLIEGGFIMQDGTENITIVRSSRTTPETVYKYNKYKFFRPLKDYREFTTNAKTGEIQTNEAINENDCLKFGECLTIASQTNDISFFDKQIEQGEGPPVLKAKNTTSNFGEGYDENLAILNQIPNNEKNDNAIPEHGELYAIVNTDYSSNGSGISPYHIAFVIYNDGDINITLEAAADKDERDNPALFSFFDRKSSAKNTFHKILSKFYIHGETIVLTYRGDPIMAIISEIDADILQRQKPQKKGKRKQQEEPQEEPQEGPTKRRRTVKTIIGGNSKRKTHTYKKKRIMKTQRKYKKIFFRTLKNQ